MVERLYRYVSEGGMREGGGEGGVRCTQTTGIALNRGRGISVLVLLTSGHTGRTRPQHRPGSGGGGGGGLGASS